jgi:hypothetical protein
LNLNLYQSGQIASVSSVHIVYPYGVKVFKHQEIAEVRLLLYLFLLVKIVSQYRLLESLLHYEVARYFLEQESKVSFLFNVIFEE